ncbi:MAG: DUF4914 family protein [Bacteroidales bacterium]
MMTDLFELLEQKRIELPDHLMDLLRGCKGLTVYNTTLELAHASTGGKERNAYQVEYDIPGKGVVTEAVVHRVKNGISANYTEAYMRRRDPDTMVIADGKPTDKKRFEDKYGYPFLHPPGGKPWPG